MNSNTDETRDDFVSDASQAQGGQASEENAKFILKNDPQTGLHLDEGDSDDCYEISASQEAPEPPTPPKPEIEEPAPGADDVYALAEPEPRPTPDQGIAPKELGGGVAPASSRAKSKKRAKNVENDEEDDVSVDSLYERRRRALEEEEEQKLIVERDPLPPLPFLTNIFKPFRSAGFLARAGMIAGTIFVPLLIVAYIFTRVLSTNVAGSFAENPDASAWTAYWGSLWAARYFFIPFCFVWGIFAVPLSIQIFVDTASGADEINDWPEFSVVGAIGQFLWIACIVVLAGIPGAFLFPTLGADPFLGMVVSATILVPIFYLSCMQADELFALVTKDVALSLKRTFKSWCVFLGIGFLFLIGTLTISAFLLRGAVSPEDGEQVSFARVAINSAILAVFFSVIPSLYLRFLGRLAWIIEDDVRARMKEQVEKETSEESRDE